jgi:hypothetical protein
MMYEVVAARTVIAKREARALKQSILASGYAPPEIRFAEF